MIPGYWGRWPPCEPLKMNNEDYNLFKEKQLSAILRKKERELEFINQIIQGTNEDIQLGDQNKEKKREREMVRKFDAKKLAKRKEKEQLTNNLQEQIQGADQLQQEQAIKFTQVIQQNQEIEGSNEIQNDNLIDYVKEIKSLKDLLILQQQQHANQLNQLNLENKLKFDELFQTQTQLKEEVIKLKGTINSIKEKMSQGQKEIFIEGVQLLDPFEYKDDIEAQDEDQHQYEEIEQLEQ